jgi:hypothetical protein
MWYARSGYVSGVISYSGGDITINRVPLQDPSHLPVGLASHGAAGSDVIGVDFNQGSHTWEMNNPKAFIVDCDDGGNHLSTGPRTMMAPQAIQMLWDHPFGITPEPRMACRRDGLRRASRRRSRPTTEQNRFPFVQAAQEATL